MNLQHYSLFLFIMVFMILTLYRKVPRGKTATFVLNTL